MIINFNAAVNPKFETEFCHLFDIAKTYIRIISYSLIVSFACGFIEIKIVSHWETVN